MSLFKKIKKIIKRNISKPVEIFELKITSDLYPEQSTTIECPNNKSILHTLLHHKIDITYYCNGTCSCGSCRIEIVSGNLNHLKAREQLVLGEEKMKRGDRLACQTYLEGPSEIRIPKYF